MTEETGQKGDSFTHLQRFSEELISLGKEIEMRLKEKMKIEEEVGQKEKEVRQLHSGVFQLKEKLIKIDLELSKLEKRRQELMGGG